MVSLRPQRPLPTSALPLVVAVGLGVLIGLGGYTFRYARGLSYLSTDPAACVNCHIMRPQYDGWQKASHHAAAVCVDCHLPEATIAKYVSKAENGWRHGSRFTSGAFAEPIQIHPEGRLVLEGNCRRCHQDLVADLPHGGSRADRASTCTHCHPTVGHGDRAGLGGPLLEAEHPRLPAPQARIAP